VSAQRERDAVVVVVEDDGRGLDPGALRARAAALGLAPSGDGSDPASAELIFVPGVSTAGGPSDLAGRGVGLSAARADLDAVRYALTVESEPGRFTRFVLRPR
jgi:two-component system chemotaxis sensor kinase CheA